MSQEAVTQFNAENLRTNFFVGGLSLLVLVFCWIFFDENTSQGSFAQAAFLAAVFLNYPHFMASYFIIYSDFKKQFKASWRYKWAAVVVPVLLLAVFSFILIEQRGDWLIHTVNLMFFLLGWHLIKQTFGAIIVLSAMKKFFYTPKEKNFILINLFSVWAISFFSSQASATFNIFYGLKVTTFNFSGLWLQGSYILFGLSLVAVIAVHILKYKREKTARNKGLAKAGLMCFVSTFSYKFGIGISIDSLLKSHAFAKPQTVWGLSKLRK